jgi:hypothetical protein
MENVENVEMVEYFSKYRELRVSFPYNYFQGRKTQDGKTVQHAPVDFFAGRAFVPKDHEANERLARHKGNIKNGGTSFGMVDYSIRQDAAAIKAEMTLKGDLKVGASRDEIPNDVQDKVEHLEDIRTSMKFQKKEIPEIAKTLKILVQFFDIKGFTQKDLETLEPDLLLAQCIRIFHVLKDAKVY